MLSRKGPLLVLQNLVNSLVGVIGLFFLARFLPISWSILSFGIAFVGLFTLISDLGFSTANVKLQSQGEDEGECNSTYLVSKLIFNSAFVGITIAALFIWVSVLHRGFQYDTEYWVVLALIPYYFFFGMVKFSNSYFTSRLKPARLVIPSIIEVILRNSIFVFIAIAFTYHIEGMSQAETAIVLSAVYSFTYSIYFIISFSFGRPWKFTKPSRRMFRKYILIALPLALSGIVSTVNQNVDKVIIQLYWSAQATGAFFLDQKIIMVLTTFSMSISLFFLPILSRNEAKGERSQLNSNLREYERLITLFSLPFATGFGMLAFYINNIFSGYFTSYAYILSLLSIWAVISLNSFPYMNALIATGRQKEVGIINVIGLTTNIVLNLVTIPQTFFGVSYLSLGVAGGAFSTIVAATFMNVAFRVELYRESGMKFNFELLKLLVPMIIQALFLYVVLIYIKPFDIIYLAPISVASVLIYTGVSILIKELYVSELVAFIKNINPLRLSKALSEE